MPVQEQLTQQRKQPGEAQSGESFTTSDAARPPRQRTDGALEKRDGMPEERSNGSAITSKNANDLAADSLNNADSASGQVTTAAQRTSVVAGGAQFVRNHPYLAGLILLLICACGVLGYLYWKHGDDAKSPVKPDVSEIINPMAVAASTATAATTARTTGPSSVAIATKSAAETTVVEAVPSVPLVAASREKELNTGVLVPPLPADFIAPQSHTPSSQSALNDNYSTPLYTRAQLQEFMAVLQSNPRLLAMYRAKLKASLSSQH